MRKRLVAKPGLTVALWTKPHGAAEQIIVQKMPGRSSRHAMHSPKPKSIDAYLSAQSAEKRAALQKLRRAIHAAAPRAEEYISYNIPAFRLDGKLLVAFGAAARHCSFFPGAHPVRTHAKELKSYSTSKGTLRFTPEHPLPAALVRKLVKSRIAQFAGPKP